MAESVGLFGAVKGLFEYNRENFIFDRTLNQERVYQIQKMRVSQVRLYRDDLRELFALTIRKMDSYLIVNALLLLFSGGLFYEGRLPQGTPAWLLWLWTMSLGSAFFFLSLSIWFAIHASITAQTFQVRLLTQWLRLPIPSAADIHAVSGGATEFEQTRAKDMLRVPGVANRQDAFNCTEKYPDVPNELLKSDLVQDYTLFVEHFYLFRDLQKHWQGFDAYARIGMVVGTNMLLSAFSYMALAYYVMSFKIMGGLVFPFIFTSFQIIHMKINLRDVTKLELATIIVLIIVPVLLASIAGVQSVVDKNTYYGDILSPIMFLASGMWIVFLVLVGSEDDGGLPCRFVTVGSIDVLGLEDDDAKFNALSPSGRRSVDDNDEDVNGKDLSKTPSVRGEREGAETPVAVAVPPAPVIARAEERRRSKIILTNSSSLISQGSLSGMAPGGDPLETGMIGSEKISAINSVGMVSNETFNEGVLLSQILESSLIVSAPSEQMDDVDEGIAPVDLNEEEEIKAYRSSLKARMLPWKGYREAGAVLVCLWIFATAYSVLASFQPRWGWPRTLPYGDGEEPEPSTVSAAEADSHGPHRRLLAQPVPVGPVVMSSTDFVARCDMDEDYGKVNVFHRLNEGEFLTSFDVTDCQSLVGLDGEAVFIKSATGTNVIVKYSLVS